MWGIRSGWIQKFLKSFAVITGELLPKDRELFLAQYYPGTLINQRRILHTRNLFKCRNRKARVKIKRKHLSLAEYFSYKHYC
jgi:hypothetical protein